MREWFDGKLTLKNDRGALSAMLIDDEQLPVVIMKLDRNKDEILGFLRLMKKVENVPIGTIKFIRGALYDIRHYNKMKFNKHNPKDELVDAELIDMTELVQDYKKQLEEEE